MSASNVMWPQTPKCINDFLTPEVWTDRDGTETWKFCCAKQGFGLQVYLQKDDNDMLYVVERLATNIIPCCLTCNHMRSERRTSGNDRK